MRRGRYGGLILIWLVMMGLLASSGPAVVWDQPPVVAASEVEEQSDLVATALAGEEEYLLTWINLMRSHASRQPLAIQPAVQSLARERSEDMARRDYFSHTTPEGETVLSMLPARGVNYSYAGETLQRNNYPAAETVEEAIRSLMDSPPHREILLDPAFTQVGVGHAVADGMHYFTVIVVQP